MFPTYAKVKYEGIYSGIDLVYYGNQRQLEYDFVVAPGANPRRIAFDVSGAKRIRQDDNGELVFKVGEDEIRWRKPVVYQEKDGARQEIAAHYAITDTNRVGLAVAKYDVSRALYIDPLVYSTYLGGSGADQGYGIAVDSSGDAYVTGYTTSTNFPVTPGAFQTAISSVYPTAFVTELNPTGSALVYSTYLGGSGGNDAGGGAGDYGHGIAVDSSGDAYVTGNTYSTNFPVTPGAFQTTKNSVYTTTFVTELNPTGSALVYSTYLGGNKQDYSYGVAVNGVGNAYVTGYTVSIDFPTTPGAFQTDCNLDSYGNCGDAFVTELNATGSALVYSTFFPAGSGGIALDSWGNVYLTGGAGANLPVTPGAFQTTYIGNGDAFVTKLNSTGSALVYSTYIFIDPQYNLYYYGSGIAVDSAGNAYVTGATEWCRKGVTARGTCFAPAGPAVESTFVTKLNSTGSALEYLTSLGENGSEYGNGIAVDGLGNAYVTGVTGESLPTTPGAFQTSCGSKNNCQDAFLAKISPSGMLVYSTYLGGSGGTGLTMSWGNGVAVDSSGNAYVTGYTYSKNFPVTPGAFQTTCGSCYFDNGVGSFGNALVTKIEPVPASTTTLKSSPKTSTYGQAVTFAAVVSSKAGTPPDGETVNFMEGSAVLGTGSLSGGTASFATSALPVGTNEVTAIYGGDSNFAASTSKAVKQVVKKAGK